MVFAVPSLVNPEAAGLSHPYVATPVPDPLRVIEMNRPPNTAMPVVDAYSVMETSHFDHFHTELEDSIITSKTRKGSSLENYHNSRMYALTLASPSLKEVEEAKQNLEECLSDVFKLITDIC